MLQKIVNKLPLAKTVDRRTQIDGDVDLKEKQSSSEGVKTELENDKCHDSQ